MVLTARKNLKLYVSDRQVEILVGCLLGDAYLTKLGKIQIEQSTKQEEYIKWKHQELASISYSGLKEVIRFDKKDSRVTRSLRFWTRQFFKSWRDSFYKNNEKVFPNEFTKWVSPLAIAFWYMDDGSYFGNQCVLSTESFNMISKEKLIERLREFEVEAILRSNGKLRIRSKSLHKFFELIRPYIHKSMMYKLSLRSSK